MPHNALSLLLFFALIGCGGAIDDSGDGLQNPIGEGPGDSGTSTTGDAVGVTYGMDTLQVADAEASFDLDGDGDPDNAVADAGRATVALLNSTLDELLSSATRVVLVQAWAVNDWTDDPAIDVGMFAGTRTETAGVVDVEEVLLDDDGEVLVHTSTALQGGSYLVALADQSFVFGDYTVEASTPVYIAGQPSEASESGVVGFGLPTSVLLSLAEATGYDSLTTLAELADLDTDGDGTADTISMAFAFEAPAVTVQ